ncbi:MAG: FtsQ-type POTRA domain-containing protein, partial [Anaerolineae bacterium]|nr:FtsQ-type POTRA domain-containing protein [Anaerolineae bacterium]
MTARQRRRATGRTPGIWQGNLESADDRPAVQHGVRGRVFVSWRLFSALIILILILVLWLFFSADLFYVHSVAVGGLQYLTKEEVFALSDIANMHIFWIDPQTVRQAILRSPTVADARVEVGWPPNMVQIIVEERQPALVWEQAGVATWIDLQGRIMQQREDRPDLLRISRVPAVGEAPAPLGPNDRLDANIVNGALQLKSLYPNVTVLRYHPDKGLGFGDAGGWEAWFGT